MDEYRFCKIFVRESESAAVERTVGGLFDVSFDRHSMELSAAIVDVIRNPDRSDGAEDFLLWPTLVEVEARDPVVPTTMREIVSRILTALWDEGVPAVAACDFEDELPWRGGIARL
ncbi:hypothetical protein [Nocardia brasiliensis]|uniref:hypothetical protein n=1 Tax=Nocardia brasiliensis TaxID=37326 RepID=UPI0033CF6B3D